MALTSQLSDLNWYVARIMSGQTAKALSQLEAAEFEFNHPTFIENKKELPLLPGYVFVRMPHDESEFAAVHELSAIDKLLPYGVDPSPVPKKWMNDFQRRMTDGAFNVEVEPDARPLPWFNKNEILLVTSGPLAGHTGTFSHVRKGAVIASVKFFGRTLEVPLKGHQVQRLM